MSTQQPMQVPPNAPVVGGDARRRFLKTTGQMAIAAPAAILLLSTVSTNATAQGYGTDDNTSIPPA